MMPVKFLEALDGMLQTGARSLGQALRNHIAQFTTSQQSPDGGFCGRQGHSDLYYTDFGFRTLCLVHNEPAPPITTLPFITRSHPPKDILECFSVLNIWRMMGPDGSNHPLDLTEIMSTLNRQHLHGGGYSRPHGTTVSAYHTFLAVLCYEILGIDVPDHDFTIQALNGLRRSDGGYSETAGESCSQTNATAAVVACLTLLGGISSDESAQTAAFLANMQSPDGGLRAIPLIHEADLLSTFTGMVCLSGLDDLGRLDLPQTARYISSLLTSDGGFRASASDGEADIEYTYYGLGALSMMRLHALSAEF
ncbi:MAG: prenyltransferase/squalene oxidase repeat-containing protein [Armatimonadota bacterium]